MAQTSRLAGGKLKGFVWLLSFTFVLRLALSLRLEWSEIICGGVVCLIISLFGAHIYSESGFSPPRVRGILLSLVYLIVLLWEIIKANFDAATSMIGRRFEKYLEVIFAQ